MASTILQQGSQEDERRAARKRSRQQSQQQVQTGILATGNLLGDVARTIPQFQANSIRESEGAKDRAFEQAMIQAKQGFEEKQAGVARDFTRGESVLDRQTTLEAASRRSDPLTEALSLLAAEKASEEYDQLSRNPRFPAAALPGAQAAILSGKTTPELEQFRAAERTAAPIKQAAAQAGILDTDLVARGEPGAMAGMGRDAAMALLGNIAIDRGENSPELRQLAEKMGYALPQRTLPQTIGRGFRTGLEKSPLTGPLMDKGSTIAEQEIMQLLEALKSQYGPVAQDRGFTSTQPLSPAARKYILSIRQQLGQ